MGNTKHALGEQGRGGGTGTYRIPGHDSSPPSTIRLLVTNHYGMRCVEKLGVTHLSVRLSFKGFHRVVMMAFLHANSTSNS